jgi:hypothetical protein
VSKQLNESIIIHMSRDQIPDYHFLLITSNLGAEWLFDAARAYWERFQPTVISDFTLLRIIPAERTISVTAITRRDRVAQLGVELAQTAPAALFDPVVFDFFEDTKLELDRRAQNNQPFGVPLATATPGPSAPPVYPTAGAVVTEVPGFVTQTPTPNPPPAETPTPQTPLYPTPGAVTGT